MQTQTWRLADRVVFSQMEDQFAVLNLEKGTSHLFSLELAPWFESLQQPKENEALLRSLSAAGRKTPFGGNAQTR